MKKREILLVINARSGKRKAHKESNEIKSMLEKEGKVILYLTQGKNDVESVFQIKKENPNLNWAVICGGDGTLNMTMTALHHFHDVKFTFLPYGTVNIFAKENHYPKRNLDALRNIIDHGIEKTIYPGFTHDKAFILMASVGFDSYLVQKVEEKAKRWKKAAYFFLSFYYAFRYSYRRQFSVSAGGQTIKANFIIIGNCRHYGGIFHFTPNASFFHDEFEVFCYQGNGFFRILYAFFLALIKKMPSSKRVHYLYGKKIHLEGSGISQMDGEVGNLLPYEIKKDKGVQFVLPSSV